MSMDKKIAFLVDFDNVATDVIEQALQAVFKDYGAAHIRRAYCNAEQALREQNFLKRLGLRAIVNLAIGKNSTDIAMAVDAMELAISEKPDVIVLVSSDSDFAPLVLRLREKGAWLRGFGQYGKTGEGVIQIYDQFNELAHGVSRSGRDAAPTKSAAGSGGRGGRRSGGGRAAGGRSQPDVPRASGPQRPPRIDAVAASLPASTPAPAAVVADFQAQAVEPAVDVAPVVAGQRLVEAVPAPAAEAVETHKASKPERSAKASKSAKAAKPADAVKAAGKPPRKAADQGEAKLALEPALPAKAQTASKPVKDTVKDAVKTPATADSPQVAAAKEINAVLALLPKLVDGQWHDLGAAAKVLKDAGLLAKSAASTKLFRKHSHAFELQPEKQPNRVRFAT